MSELSIFKKQACLVLGFPDSSMAKILPANAGTSGDAGSIPGQEDPMEEEMPTHSTAGQIDGLHSM